MKKILLAGATGFLGGYLARKLVSDGYELYVSVRGSSNRNLLSDIAENVVFIDVEFIQEFMNEKSIDVVINAATNYGRNGSAYDVFDSNVRFCIELAQHSISNGVKLFINTDTFFNIKDDKYDYLNEYVLSKRHAVEWLKMLSMAGSMKVVNLKLGHLYGKGDADGKFLTWLIKELNKTENEVIKLTLGEQKRDFIHVSDVSDAYSYIVDCDIKPQFSELDVCTGHLTSIRDFVETLSRELVNSGCVLKCPELKFGAIAYRKGEIMIPESSSEKINDLGWSYKVSVLEGIKDLVNKN